MKDSIELRDKGCRFCNEGSIKPSYDDEDGMIACVHDTPPNRYGDKQLTWWLTVGFRGEQRDFVIEFCPFCGRRLNPLKIIAGEMQTQIDDEIYRAVQNVGINVDREELLKALEYDRGQYEKGFNDGFAQALEIALQDAEVGR